MVTLLRKTLDADPRLGISFSQLLMITDGRGDFKDLKQEFKKKAKFSQCPKHFCNHSISVHCKTCSKIKLGNFCVECFLKGNHEGHDYSITQNNLSSCICGHETYADPQSFCGSHCGHQEKETEDILTNEQRELYSQIFQIHAQYLADNFPRMRTEPLLKFILNLCPLGETFVHLYANAFITGEPKPLTTMLDNFPKVSYHAAMLFAMLCASLVSVPKFAEIFNESFILHVPEFLATEFQTNRIVKTIFDAASIPYNDVDFATKMIKDNGLLTVLLKAVIEISNKQPTPQQQLLFRRRPEENIPAFYIMPPLLLIAQATQHSSCARAWSFELPDAFDTLMNFLRAFQFPLPIVRKTGDREPFNSNDILYMQLVLSTMNKVVMNFDMGYKMYFLDENGNKEIKDHELSEEDLSVLMSRLSSVIGIFMEWYVAQEIPEIESKTLGIKAAALNPLVDKFSYGLPLNVFVYRLVNSLRFFYKVPIPHVLEAIGEAMLPLVIHPLELVAAVGLAQANAYVRNNENVLKVANDINLGVRTNQSLVDKYGLMQLYLESTDDPTPFVAAMIHAHGLTSWIDTGNSDGAVEVQEQIVLLCRNFITILSSLIQKMTFSVEERLRAYFIHFLFLKPSTAKDLKAQTPTNANNISMWYSLLDEVAVTIKNEKSAMYKLRPEYAKKRTPFFPCYLSTAFYDSMSRDMDAKNPGLLPVPEVEHEFLPRVPRLVLCPAFQRTLRAMALHVGTESPINTTSLQCFLALLQMSVQASAVVGDDSFARSLIEGDDCLLRLIANEASMKDRSIRLPITKLSTFVGSVFPDLAAAAATFNAPYEEPDKKEQSIDRDAILGFFNQRGNAFEAMNSFDDIDEEEEEKEDSYICAFCKVPINPAKEPFGLMARVDNRFSSDVDEQKEVSAPLFTVCPHYAHMSCFNESRDNKIWTQCPLCRTACSCLLPALKIGHDDTQEPLTLLFNDTAGRICHIAALASSFFRRIEMILRVDPEHHVTDIERSAAKYLLALVEKNAGKNQNPRPATKRAFTILQQISFISDQSGLFVAIKNAFGPNPVPLTMLRRCVVAANLTKPTDLVPLADCAKLAADHGLNITNEVEPSLFLSKAFKRFTSYFLEENDFPSKTNAYPRGDIARCMLCGRACMIVPRRHQTGDPSMETCEAHSKQCPFGMPIFLVLTGKSASAIVYYTTQRPMAMIEWGSIYQTERGDQDIGLTLLSDLYLNEKLVTMLKKDLFDGKLYRNSARRDIDRIEEFDIFF